MDYNEVYNRNRVSWLYAVARSPDIGSNAVRVGLLFATFFNADERKEVSPSYEWLMENARLKSRSTLSKALKELEQAGFLEIHRNHRYRNHYAMPFTGEGLWSLSPKNGL